MPIPILTTISSMRRLRSTLSGRVSLVPTMGMLHHGHSSLIRLAASHACSVIVSIYVNPTQLSPTAREAYPSTLKADTELLEQLNHELGQEEIGAGGRIVGIFAPADGEMYPHSSPGEESFERGGRGSFVNVAPLADGRLEGMNQPWHFVGVATVCLKLFNVVNPHVTCFGEKDYQQTVIVKRMVQDLLLDLEIVVGETVREGDGLAVSSRNVFLGNRRRKVATVLWRALCAARDLYDDGERKGAEFSACCCRVVSEEQARQSELSRADRVSFNVLYFEVSDLDSLEKISKIESSQGALLSGAIQMFPLEDSMPSEDVGWHDGRDSIRLLDSMVLQPGKTKM